MEASVSITVLRELLCIKLLPQKVYIDTFARIEAVHLHLISINSGVFSVSYLHPEYSVCLVKVHLMHTAPLQGVRYTLAVRQQAGKQLTWRLDVQFHTWLDSFSVGSHPSLVGSVVCWPASDTVAGRRSSVVGCVAEACSVVVAPGATGPWRATGWPCNWLRGMVCVTGGSDAPVERWRRSRARNTWLAEKLHKVKMDSEQEIKECGQPTADVRATGTRPGSNSHTSKKPEHQLYVPTWHQSKAPRKYNTTWCL